jgi:hypothetical protein
MIGAPRSMGKTSETRSEGSEDGKRAPSVSSQVGDDAGRKESGEEAEGEQGGREGCERHAGGESWCRLD